MLKKFWCNKDLIVFSCCIGLALFMINRAIAVEIDTGITQKSIDLVQVLLYCFLAVGAAFVSVLGWLGIVVREKLEKVSEGIEKVNSTMTEIKEEIQKDIAKHDTRIAIVETKLNELERNVERRRGN